MTSQTHVRVGAQRPRLHSCPPSRTTAGQEAIDLAASAGVYLDDWQQHVLLMSLGEAPDGRWTTPEVGLIVPRQNGKGEVLLALELAALFLYDAKLIVHTAHEFKTATEAFIRLKHVILNAPHLHRKVRSIREANGEQGVELLNGNRLRFLARSKGSGRGFSCDLLILDEAYALTAAQMGAIRFTMSARPNYQMWLTSSAGHADSEVLHGLRARGIEGVHPRLCFLEWSAHEKRTDDDVEGWYEGNPALGIRIEDQTVADELAGATSDDLRTEFRRERLGITEDDTALAVIDPATWAARTDLHAILTGTVALAIDTTPDRSMTAIGSAGAGGDGRCVVDVIDHRPGTAWVVERIVELRDKHKPCAIAVDPRSPAGSLIPDLEAAGVEVLEVATGDATQACGGFYDAVRDDTLRHLSQPSLNLAVAGARKRELSEGAWLWDRKKSADICPLVACTNARWAWTVHGQGAEREFWGAWG